MNYKLIMIYNDNCYYCKIAKPIIKDFENNNKNNYIDIKVEYIQLKDYKGQFGPIQSVPQFYFVNNKNKTIKQFDFYDNITEKRTYNKLIQTLNKLKN
jgi:hypothetical protein